MTKIQYHILAQTYGSGPYGGETYQCTGDNCETQTGITAPSTAVPQQENFFDFGVMAIILAASVVVAGVIVFVKKRITKSK